MCLCSARGSTCEPQSNNASSLTANMASLSPLIKFDVCMYKKDEVSYDDFVEWATRVYPVKAKPLMQKYVVKWTQASHPDCLFTATVLNHDGPTNKVIIWHECRQSTRHTSESLYGTPSRPTWAGRAGQSPTTTWSRHIGSTALMTSG